MLLAILLTISGIMFILALIYFIGFLVHKRETSTRKKYQEHIDNLVNELFPPAIPTIPTIPTPAIQVPTTNESYETDTQYQEAKRKMVADIRTYFNQRKLDEAIRDTEIAIRDTEIKTGLPMNSPMFSSGPDTTPLPSPSIPPEVDGMTLSITAHIGTISGRFLGRYTRPKTGIFSRSQYKTLSLPKLCIKAYSRLSAPSLPKVPYIAKCSLTFTHGEVSQKFFAKNFGLFSKSHAEFAPYRSTFFRRTQQKPRLCPKPRKNRLYVQNPCLCCRPKNFFQKIFSKKNSEPKTAIILHSEEIFPKKIFPIFSQNF